MSFSYPYDTEVVQWERGAIALTLERLRSLDATIDGFFALYEKTGREELFEDLCPYFGVPWPAGEALAERAAELAPNWRGQRVLELACGLALPSLVLARLGSADVVASDLHPDVPEFLKRNEAHNHVRVGYRALDWREVQGVETDILLGSDLVYDRRQPPALLAFLERTRWREALIADPGRPYWEAFVASLRTRPWAVEESVRGTIRFVQLRNAAV